MTTTIAGVSACFPCYNDEHSIAEMVRDAHDTLTALGLDFEIIVTNDGSRDGSAAVLDALAAELPALKVIHHEVNRGYGGALLSCFRAATKEWIFYTDGDAQYDATEVAALVAAVGPDTDIVQGYKIGRGDPWHRKIIGRAYHHVVKLVFRLPVRDTDCDFRLFRRSLFERADLRSTTGVICVEMMYRYRQLDAHFVEVGVHHFFRPHGRSQFFRLPQISRAALGLGQLWWRLIVRRSGS
jgi:glycosyltransferase involved in cell wall biosynthesis